MTLKPRLILHIGMHKTGSTSLQRYFVRNRLLLRALGIHYPKGTGADGRPLPKHNDLFLSISHEKDNRGAPHPTLGPSSARIREIGLRLKRNQITVLSAEGLSGQSRAFASAFSPLCMIADVRVICFLRRQDDWVRSLYKQMVLSREVRESRTFEEFLAMPRIRRHLDYATILRWWSAAVGRENIRILIYPPSHSILDDFLQATDLPGILRYLPFSNSVQNPSRPSTYIERARLANAANQPLPSPDPTDRDEPMFTDSSRRLLLDSHNLGNEWIRTTFRPDLDSLFE